MSELYPSSDKAQADKPSTDNEAGVNETDKKVLTSASSWTGTGTASQAAQALRQAVPPIRATSANDKKADEQSKKHEHRDNYGQTRITMESFYNSISSLRWLNVGILFGVIWGFWSQSVTASLVLTTHEDTKRQMKEAVGNLTNEHTLLRTEVEALRLNSDAMHSLQRKQWKLFQKEIELLLAKQLKTRGINADDVKSAILRVGYQPTGKEDEVAMRAYFNAGLLAGLHAAILAADELTLAPEGVVAAEKARRDNDNEEHRKRDYFFTEWTNNSAMPTSDPRHIPIRFPSNTESSLNQHYKSSPLNQPDETGNSPPQNTH